MRNDEIQDYINKAIEKAVRERLAGRTDAFTRTEALLRDYELYKASEEPEARRAVEKIDKALDTIINDPYYDIVPLFYVAGWTCEAIADKYGAAASTIYRNKRRLVERVKKALFLSESIRELL